MQGLALSSLALKKNQGHPVSISMFPISEKKTPGWACLYKLIIGDSFNLYLKALGSNRIPDWNPRTLVGLILSYLAIMRIRY